MVIAPGEDSIAADICGKNGKDQVLLRQTLLLSQSHTPSMKTAFFMNLLLNLS